MPPLVPPPLPSVLSALTPSQALQLGLFAARMLTVVGGAVAVFGLLFIPSPDNVHVEEDVEGIPGLRYSWNRDETTLYLTYDRPGDAKRTVALRINDKGEVLDDEGRVVGKVIGDKKIAIDRVAILPDLVKQDEPRLCPKAEPDRPGSDRGRKDEDNPARQYEDFVKLIINPPPEGPTPSGYAYYLPNPKENGNLVSFDDCELKSGRIVFEIKGETYAHLLTTPFGSGVERDMLNQSARQIASSGGRTMVWVFAEKEAAERALDFFDKAGEGRQYIIVVHIPWVKRNP